jgi:hypothetical protein
MSMLHVTCVIALLLALLLIVTGSTRQQHCFWSAQLSFT